MEKRFDIIFLTKHLSKLFEKKLDENIKSVGLTPQQGRILFLLKNNQNEKINQCDIERVFHLSKSTVSGLIKRLLTKKLIVRKRSGINNYLFITEEGLKTIDKFINVNKELQNEVLEDFSEEEKNKLFEQLNILINKFEEGGDINETKD